MAIRAVRPVGEAVPTPAPAGMAMPDTCAADGYTTYFVGNGTQALAATLRDSRRKDAPNVLLPSYGCPDLVAATVYAGCIPVLIDTEPDSPFPSIEAGATAVSRGDVCAVVVPHFLGIRCDLGPWLELCRRHNVVLVEDSAQALLDPASNDSRGDSIVLSFGRGKPLSVGGGGALLSRRRIEALEAFQWRVDRQRVPGSVDFHAAMQRRIFNAALWPAFFGIAKRMPFLEIGSTRYRAVREITGMRPYLKRCLVAASARPKIRGSAEAAIDRCLASISGGWRTVPGRRDPRGLLRYPLLAPSLARRNAAVEQLGSLGVTPFYGRTLGELPGMPSMRCAPAPSARAFADRLLTLPVHSGVTEAHVAAIARVLENS